MLSWDTNAARHDHRALIRRASAPWSIAFSSLANANLKAGPGRAAAPGLCATLIGCTYLVREPGRMAGSCGHMPLIYIRISLMARALQ